MTHPLDGARLKVVRAQEHIDALKAEIRMYSDEKPYTVASKQHIDPEGRPIAASFEPIIHVPPPIRFSSLIGDCLTNLRAALDYIAWELADKYIVPSVRLDKDSGRWVSFPIRHSGDPPPEGYVNKINRFANRMPHGFPAAAIDMIKAIQPNVAGYEPIWWLETLVNTDKHRLPLLTIAAINTAEAEMTVAKIVAGVITEVATSRGFPSISSSDQFIATNVGSGDHVQVSSQAAVLVTFQDIAVPLEPVDRTLEQIRETVTNIIPRFDRFF